MVDSILVKLENEEESRNLAPPFGILFLADRLEKAGFSVRLVHEVGTRDNVQAVVDWYGPVDITQGPVLFTDDPCQIGLEMLNAKYGGEETQYFYWTLAWSTFLGGSLGKSEILEKAQLATPIKYIDIGDPPVLIIHGLEDHSVPVSQSELLYQVLLEIGVEVILKRVPGFGHAYLTPENQVAPELLEPTLEFLRYHLNLESP